MLIIDDLRAGAPTQYSVTQAALGPDGRRSARRVPDSAAAPVLPVGSLATGERPVPDGGEGDRARGEGTEAGGGVQSATRVVAQRSPLVVSDAGVARSQEAELAGRRP